MTYRIAVVGATGNVGREMLNIINERQFPYKSIVPLASNRSKGKEVAFGDTTLKTQVLDDFDFSETDIVFMSAGGEIARKWAPIIAKHGAVVIDNSSTFRMDPDVPLVVPEVNPESIALYKNKKIIANPNCSTIQLAVALKPLHSLANIKRVVVSTYQSVSGAGAEAMDELFNQTKSIYINDKTEPVHFTKQIAFNVIPHIDIFLEDGSTKEEWKMISEMKKIVDPKIKLSATCVRVPVFVGHSEAVNIEFDKPIDENEARDVLRKSPGILVIDKQEDGGYITPFECVGEYATFISRIRTDPTIENGLNIWVVSDNLRKGAALNAVQIGESLIKNYLHKSEPSLEGTFS